MSRSPSLNASSQMTGRIRHRSRNRRTYCRRSQQRAMRRAWRRPPPTASAALASVARLNGLLSRPPTHRGGGSMAPAHKEHKPRTKLFTLAQLVSPTTLPAFCGNSVMAKAQAAADRRTACLAYARCDARFRPRFAATRPYPRGTRARRARRAPYRRRFGQCSTARECRSHRDPILATSPWRYSDGRAKSSRRGAE